MTRYRINQVQLGLDQTVDDLPEAIKKKLSRKRLKIEDMKIQRLSIDARHKKAIKKVYTVDFTTNSKLDLKEAPDMSYKQVKSGDQPLYNRPVIIGFGPCGIFCALELAYRGYRPIVIERGGNVEEREAAVQKLWNEGVIDNDCNVQFGEGGAGTFSDGKLNSGISDVRTHFVLEEFVKAGAQEEILYDQKPHVGTDVLKTVVKNIREKIIELGGDVIFDHRMDEIDVGDGSVHSVTVLDLKEKDVKKRYKTIDTENVVLAIGHSARDTVKMLIDCGMTIEPKPFSMGLRIEHDQSLIDKAMYGKESSELGLPPASYNLSYKASNGRGVYTFCMCPGGEVISAASHIGQTVTNGMSNSKRDSGRANSAVLVDVRPTDYSDIGGILSGFDFQERFERRAFRNGGANYKPPVTTWADFRDDTEAARPVRECLPGFVADSIKEAVPEFGKKIKGFDNDDAKLYAVETRSSSPIRLLRDDVSLSSEITGLYPAGEGAGYAGGIMSSACDGLKIAEKIIEKYKPFDKID
ncbi:MAG: NAD(FAD)-utilizing dehydrogenase [Eubacteriales bacterium]|nr:NAD(FAD)-utilizing dehydrogenase [Eubacteriales bacterium]